MAGAVSAEDLQLADVLQSSAVTAPARIDFREERHNRLLREPLVLTGYLEYLTGGRLRKVVETPFRESYLIDDEQILVDRDGEQQTLSLQQSRPLQAMLGGVAALLAGQAEQLQEIFDYELDGDAAQWTLTLQPRSRRLARHLDDLIVSGGDAAIGSIRIDLDGGEWQLMQIGPQTAAE